MPAEQKSARDLAGEVALVTGASSGIGAATAVELAREGAKVVLAARRVDRLEAQAEAIRAEGGEALVIPADLGDAAQVTALAEQAAEAFGRIDVLVNNAGVFWARRFAETSEQEVSRVLNVNLLGAMLLTRAVLPGMLARRHGAIISVASLAGRVAMEPLYSATKYGLRGFTLAMRRQLTGTGVSASLVSPGNIATPMTSNVDARLPGPELVASTIAKLIVNPRREVVIPRVHYTIAWLEQAFPSAADVAHRKRNWARLEETTATW
ncbi:MAG TPA: SDR family oxidoreductase [Thermoleophilaceae bacterium]|nr:SDR family oxidoreductase [Thermoleophilaceae bacterium]